MTKVFLVCSGLGRISRGYESFAQECFEALAGSPEIALTLFQGGGVSGATRGSARVVLWNLPRLHPLPIRLGKALGKDGYLVEQMTFGLSLMPHLLREKPDVVYFSDFSLGTLLFYWRRLTRQKFTLLFRNGGPMVPPYLLWDWTQQLAPVHLAAAEAAGQPPESHGLLPPGICIAPELAVLTAPDRAALRRSLDLPEDRPVVLSVGAVNRSLKRMDFVIREIATLPEPRPLLVILGQEDEETPEIRALAGSLLGDDCLIRSVPRAEVPKYYQAADVFVLASRLEGFGRAYVEAISWGLPCLAHDSPLTRHVLGDSGSLGNFESAGTLAPLIVSALAEGYDADARPRRHADAYRRYSWEALRPQYLAMLQRCAALYPCAALFGSLACAAQPGVTPPQ